MARPELPFKEDFLETIVAVQWGGRPFLLLQAEAFMGLSRDGLTWEKVKAPVANLWHGAFGTSAFVVSNTGFPSLLAFRSVDRRARSWTRVSVPFPAQHFVNGIVSGNGLIAMCAGPVDGSGGPKLAVSEDDGRTWALRSTPGGINAAINTDLYRGANLSFSGADEEGENGLFFFYGQVITDVDPVSYRQAIGYDWTVPEVIYSNVQQTPSTATQSVLYHSPDCMNWTGPISVFPVTQSGGDTVTFTNPLNPAESVTVPATDPYPLPALQSSLVVYNVANYGAPGSFFAANPTNLAAAGFAFSANGSTWNVESSEYRNYQGNIAGNPDGLNIASGTNLAADGKFLVSASGGALQASGNTELAFNLNAIPVWGSEKFVTCGFTDVYTSDDGLTWVNRGNPTGSAFLHRVVY